MDAGALTAIPVLLAGVLLVSGVLKLHDRERTAAAMADLGVPFAARLDWAAPLVPWAEIVLAVALVALPGWGLLVAGWVAAVLFAGLTVLVARAAARHEPVHCNCFGALSTEPVSGMTVLRNLVLTAAAAAVGLGVTGSVGVVGSVLRFDRQSTTWFVVVLGFSVVAALVWTTSRRRPASRPVDAGPAAHLDPAAGPAALLLADEELVTASGAVVTVRELSAGRAQLLIVVTADCHACSRVLSRTSEWARALESSVDVRTVSASKAPDFAAEHPGAAGDAYYGSRGIRTLLGVTAYPAAVLVGRDLTLAAGPVYGSDEVAVLVGGIVEALGSARD